MSIFLPIAEQKTYPEKGGRVPRRRDAPSRIVIHTTETARLPGYRGGSVAPHFTIGVGDPGSLPNEDPGKVRIWQHISLDRTASALKHNPGTIETNHMGAHCIQIECITYIGDQDKAGIVGNKGKFPKALSKALAGLVDEITAALGDININIYPEKWSATGSYGEKASQRLTEAEWESFNGICGHEHVPNNTHWDPGAFDIDEFMGYIIADQADDPAGTAGEPSSPVQAAPQMFHVGDSDARVLLICGILQGLGYGDFTADGLYDSAVANAVERLQEDLGTRADGIWGPTTHGLARAQLMDRLRWYSDTE
jgi:hypothetical protein